MQHHPSLLALLLFFITSSRDLFLLATAKTVTRYIDDTYGDAVTGFVPIYFPTGDKIWQDQGCGTPQGCLIVPDTRRTHNQTYTAATYRTNMNNMGLTLRFQGRSALHPLRPIVSGLILSTLPTGTGIAVYFILANDDYQGQNVVTLTECNFTLDGTLRKEYVHNPKTRYGTEYDVEVFKEEGLDNRLHILDIETGKKNYEVYIAFDYATYTAEVPDDSKEGASVSDGSGETSSKSKTPTGAIVGGAVGGIVLLAAGAILAFVLFRKRRQRDAPRDLGFANNGSKENYLNHITPFTGQREFDPYRSNAVPKPFDSPTPGSHVPLIYGYQSDTRAPTPVNAPGNGSSEKAHLRKQQMERMREELSSLQSQQSRVLSFNPSSDGGSSEISELREQIRHLQDQLSSMQAQNLNRSDAPPPEYTS
ncbi:hypothetical protein V5O48_016579 [Marasmius crinis-equi]|uniref:Uncharacterized protein n=1 Tax=Marasmius crinis-equi TaxID=585013 RepID=A0ABR3ERB2_9AGAR